MRLNTVFLLGVLSVIAHLAVGQTGLYNNDTYMMVEQDGLLYIPGNYQNRSLNEDEKLFLKGTLKLGGDFVNIYEKFNHHAIDETETDTTIYGTLNVIGKNVEIRNELSSDSNLDPIYIFLPRLTLTDSVSLRVSSDLHIKTHIDLAGGNVELNDVTISYRATIADAIVNESVNHTFSGTGSIDFHAYEGLSESLETNNFQGTGLGFKLDGSSSLAQVDISRVYDNQKLFDVAGNTNHSKRYYTFEVPTDDEDRIQIVMPELMFNFYPQDVSDIDSLTIYVSDTLPNQVAWIKLNSTTDTPNSLLKTSGFSFLTDYEYTLLLASGHCESVPDTAPIVTRGSLTEGDTIRVCLDDTVTLRSDQFFSRWIYDNVVTSGYSSNSLEIVATDAVDDREITLYQRNQDGCEHTSSYTLKVIAPPDVDFSWAPNNQFSCLGDILMFSDSSTSAESVISSYSWDFQSDSLQHVAGSSMTVANPSLVYGEPGSYNVELTVTDSDGCYSMSDETVFVNHLPSPVFSFANGQDSVICAEEIFTIDNESIITDINDHTSDDGFTTRWSFSAGLDPVLEKDLENYAFYDFGGQDIFIQLTDKNSGCINYDTIHMHVNPLPTPNFEFLTAADDQVIASPVDAGVCQGIVKLNNTSTMAEDEVLPDTIVAFQWLVGAAVIDESRHTEYSFGHGVYAVTLVDSTNNGCVDTVTHQIRIHPQPHGDFLIKRTGAEVDSACIDDPLDFISLVTIDTGVVATYLWEFGDGSTGNDSTVSHSYTSPSNFDVSLAATSDQGCLHEVKYDKNFAINPIPYAGFSYEEVCEGDDITLVGDAVDGTQLSYEWDINGEDRNGQHVFYTTAEGQSELPVKLTVTSSTQCSSDTSMHIPVHQKPDLVVPASMVAFSELQYSPITTSGYPQIGEADFVWLNSLGETISSTSVLSVTTSGVYSLVLSPLSGYCDSTFTSSVLVIQPSNTFGETTRTCSSLTLNARPATIPPTGSFSYQWSYEGASLGIASDVYEVAVAESGWYTVDIAYTNSDTTIFYTDSVEVLIEDSVEVNLGADQVICEGQSTRLETDVAGDRYLWKDSKGDTLLDGSQSFLEVSEGGLYELVVFSSGCSSNATVTVSTVDPSTADFALSQTEVCVGAGISFTNLSLPASGDALTAYSWDFGDGTFSTEMSPTKAYLDSGSYEVVLTAYTEAGCIATRNATINVNPNPIVDFEFTAFCQSQDVGLINNTSGFGDDEINYIWDFGDDTRSTEAEPSKSYNAAGDYTITLTAQTANGCTSTSSKIITISPKPTIQFEFLDQASDVVTQACEGTEVFLNNTSLVTEGSPSYLWDFGDGASSTERNPSHVFTTRGTYTVKLTVSTSCTYTLEKSIAIRPTAHVDFDFTPVCEQEGIQLENHTTIANGSYIDSYQWDFGDGSSSTAISPTHTYDRHGSYTITLTAFTTKGCETSISKTVDVYRKPTFDLGNYGMSVSGSYLLDPGADELAYIPEGATIQWLQHGILLSSNQAYEAMASGVYDVVMTSQFPENCEYNASISVYILDPKELGEDLTVCEEHLLDAAPIDYPPNSEISYSWYKDGVELNAFDSEYRVTESGQYQVAVTMTLTEEEDAPSMSYTDEIQITIQDPSEAVDLGEPVSMCQGGTTILSTNMVADSYQWTRLADDVPLGTESSQEVDEPGWYQLEITSGVCNSVGSVEVVEVLPPVAGFLASASYCVGSEISFTDMSFTDDMDQLITNYNWNFGDGTSSSLQNPTKTYGSVGNYEVSLTVGTDYGCTNTYVKQIVVESLAQPIFFADKTCLGDRTYFTNQSVSTGSVTYLWDFGDGHYSQEQNPNHLYESSGIFDVTLTLSGQCEVSETVQVEVLGPLPVFAKSSVSTCGASIDLDAGGGMTSYQWFDVSTNTTLATTQTYTESTNRELGIEYTNANGCTFTEIVSVALEVEIVADLGEERTVCGSTTLNPGSFPGGSFVWSTGETTPTIEVSTTGTYSVSLTDQNGCVATDEVHIEMVNAPQLELGPDVDICSGDELILDAGNAGASFTWSTGEHSQSILVTASGTYAVEVSNGSCTVTDTVTLNVLNPLPIDFEFTGSCSGSASSFKYTGSEIVIDYLWDFGDGTRSSKASPDKTFVTSGTHEVSLTVTNSNGCEITKSKAVEITPQIIPDFSIVGACENTALAFENKTTYAGTDALDYWWDFGDGFTSSEESPTHVYASAGTYTVRLETSNSLLCFEELVKFMEVKAGPQVNLPDVETCNNPTVLDAGNEGVAYQWSDGSSNSTLAITSAGTYWVRVTGSNQCSVIDTVEVSFYDYDLPSLEDELDACGSVLLDPQVSSTSYEWSTGETSSTISVESSGTYWVKTISEDFCIGRDTVVVAIHSLPEFDLGNAIELCEGDSGRLSATNFISAPTYSWNNGATSSAINVSESGTYNLKVTSSEGCEFEDSVKVIVQALPNAVLEDSYAACEQLRLTANGGNRYVWSTADVSAFIDVINSDTYWVQITDENECAIIDSTYVEITPTPLLELGFDQEICSGETLTLDAENVGATYVWSTGETTQFIDVSETGTYAVEVSYGGCFVTDTIAVRVLDDPIVDFEYGTSCSGATTSFTYTGNSSELNFLWDFGDGSKSTLQSPEKVFSTAGSFSVQLTVTNTAGCSASLTKIVDVLPRIQPTFGFNVACANSQVNFTNGTTYGGVDDLSYEWYFGDGHTSTMEVPMHIYETSGQYIVRLDVTNTAGCTESISKVIEVMDRPEIDLGGELASCAPSVIVNAGASGSTYRWSDNSSGQTLTITNSGTYYVTVTSPNGCVISDTLDVVLYEYDRADLGADLEDCGNVVLDANAVAVVYEWSNGERSAQVDVELTDTYWVRTISEEGCESTDTIDVVVNPLPTFELGNDLEICEGSEAVLEAHSEETVVAYTWSTGATSPSISVTETGVYTANLTSDLGCEYADEILVEVNHIPSYPLEDTYLACESLRLEAENRGNVITWSDGSTLPYLDITESGNYWVEIMTSAGCTIVDSTYVDIKQLPVPDLGVDVELCYGEEVVLDAGEFSSYTWNGITGGRYLTVGQTGEYEVTVTNDFGCEQSDVVQVVIRPELERGLPDELLVCEGSVFSLDAGISGGSYTYEWGSNSGVTGSQQILDDATDPGLYWVTVTNDFGCSQTEVVNVTTTSESIQASFLLPSVVNTGERVNFVQLTEPTPQWYQWDFGDGFTTSSSYNPTKYYMEAGEYIVSLTVSNGVCEHTLSKTISVREGRSTNYGDDKIQFVAIDKFDIYPNPPETYINFEFELSAVSVSDLEIYSLAGDRIDWHVMQTDAALLQLDITTYPNGMYIVVFKAGSSVRRFRFMKLK